MSVKQVQFSYDDKWFKRKQGLGKSVTWRKIMEAGIISLENGEVSKISRLIKIIRMPEKEEGVLIDRLHYTKSGRLWEELDSYESMKPGSVFRFRSDEVILDVEGKKNFVMLTLPEDFDGKKLSFVFPIPKL